jgi:AcrR family transcriptional regulator
MAAPESKRGRGRPPEGVREAILKTTHELIRERGIARLTTKEVAARGGFSEASIYYHFTDKAAVLEGVILEGVLAPFQEFTAAFQERAGEQSLQDALLEFTRALRAFWEKILPLLSAVQSDAELRTRFQDRLNTLDLGPHRGVRLVSEIIRRHQEAGRVRADVDPTEAAMLICAVCYLSGYNRHMLGPKAQRKLPSLGATVSSMVALLET